MKKIDVDSLNELIAEIRASETAILERYETLLADKSYWDDVTDEANLRMHCWSNALGFCDAFNASLAADTAKAYLGPDEVLDMAKAAYEFVSAHLDDPARAVPSTRLDVPTE